MHTDHKLTLVFEYLDQDLKHYLDHCEGGLETPVLKVRAERPWLAPSLRPSPRLTLRRRQSFLFQLIRGVAYCHHHRVLHRCVARAGAS